MKMSNGLAQATAQPGSGLAFCLVAVRGPTRPLALRGKRQDLPPRTAAGWSSVD